MSDTAKKLIQMLSERILLIDGAMGTLIDEYDIKSKDFGKTEYDGCMDYLSITRPEVISSIHKEYLKAGSDIIETNTFGANLIDLKSYELESQVIEINQKAAIIAKKSISAYSDRFVAGSMGPTSKSISVTGGVTFDYMKESYYLQSLGLIQGGCDLLILETGQDTLNIKAGILGIEKAKNETGIYNIPVFISSSIMLNGKMLAGQDIEAFHTSINYANPFAVGLNCAVGPAEISSTLKTLSEITDKYVFAYPNNGLPDEHGNYILSPDSFAEYIKKYIDYGYLNIVGGCCGSGTNHIKKLRETIKGRKPRIPSHKIKIFSISGIENFNFEENIIRPVLIGERANVQGSRRFKKLIQNNKYDKAVNLVKEQTEYGASIIDVCVEDTSINEKEAIKNLYPRLTKAIKKPIMIDSTTPASVEIALKYCQGKSVINSINIEGGIKKLDSIMNIITRYGCAVIAGMIDENGMAISYDEKIKTAKRFYRLLTEEYMMSPYDIIFDMLVFTVDTGYNPTYKGSAKATIDAVKEIKKIFPEIKTVLGISNVSFGLPLSGREVLNSIYLYHCVKAGLDFAIVNPSQLRRYNTLTQKEKRLSEDLIFYQNHDALFNFIEYFREKPAKNHVNSTKDIPHSIEEAVVHAITTGHGNSIERNIRKLLKNYEPLEIVDKFLMRGMDEVGMMFGNGELIVTEVLQSAEVMQSAVSILEPMLPKYSVENKKKILLATVKGDVHDIGKNLVNIIFSSNGYNVIDIGTKVDSQNLINNIEKHKPDVIGLSGLLVKSAKNMITMAEDLRNKDITIPIIIGGAAISKKFVQKYIQPVYSGRVFYSENAMTGLTILKDIFDSNIAS